MTPLDHALAYAWAGWPVFPCEHRQGPHAKAPLVPKADRDEHGKEIPRTGGLWRASADETKIRAWWRTRPRALIGVPMGLRSGVFVIDLDPRPKQGEPEDVEETLARLVAAVGALPPGPVSETQSGGRHYWFRCPDDGELPKSSAKRLKNIDWRGDGGYVIVPPSVMDDGAAYRWLVSPDEAPFPAPPAALLDLMFRRGAFAPPARDHGPDVGTMMRRESVAGGGPGDEAVRRYGLAALDAACRRLSLAPPGQRNDAANNEALAIGHLVGAGALGEGVARAALVDAAMAWGIPPSDKAVKVGGTIERALRDGAAQPMDMREIRRKAEERAARRGQRPPPVNSAEDYGLPAVSGGDALRGEAIALEREPASSPDASSAACPDAWRDDWDDVRDGSPAPSPESASRRPSHSGGAVHPPAEGGAGGDACRDMPLTDLGNARRFVARFGGEFCFVREWGWLAWDGRRWGRGGAEKRLEDRIKRTVELIAEEAEEIRTGPDDHVVRMGRAGPVMRSDQHRDWAEKSQAASHITCIRGLALSDLEQPFDAFDADPMAVNVLNGTLRIRKHASDPYVMLHPHRREDRITKLAPVLHDPAAACPRFDLFMNEVQPDETMQRYLDAWGGLSLTGLAEQVLLFLYGKGRNGKSVWVEAVASVAGDYGETVPIETFLDQGRGRKGSDATPDLAALPGVRMLRTSEPERGAKLAESLIKLVTGGEPIRARYLNKDFFSFKPQFKLTIQGNYRPKILGADEGIWGRLQLVPWSVFIPPDRRDRTLTLKLQAEASGILNRLLGGLCDYLDNGLPVPAEVTESTAEYRAESDPLGRFLEACTEHRIGSRVQSTQLARVFNAWARANGEAEWTPKGLGGALRDRGLASKKADVIWWLDIALTRTEADFAEGGSAGIGGRDWDDERA